MRVSLIFFKITIIIFLGLISCDAPHLNPLDPENPNSPVAEIEGIIRTEKIPRIPLSNVKVIWEIGNIVVKTDENGNFHFKSLQRKNGWLYFEKDGYSVDSVYIDWNSSTKIDIERFLNSIPRIDSLIFSSTTRNRFPNIQEFDLDFKVSISDEENDIDSVFVKNDDLEFYDLLNYNSSTRLYELFVPNDEIEFGSIEQVIGKDFDMIVIDNSGEEFFIGSSNIERIIKDEIDFISPANNESVSVPFTLRWRRFEPGYNFHYRIEIFTNDILQRMVWSADNILLTEVNYEVTLQLASGQYFWVIWCIDEFGNKGSSKPATFQVN